MRAWRVGLSMRRRDFEFLPHAIVLRAVIIRGRFSDLFRNIIIIILLLLVTSRCHCLPSARTPGGGQHCAPCSCQVWSQSVVPQSHAVLYFVLFHDNLQLFKKWRFCDRHAKANQNGTLYPSITFVFLIASYYIGYAIYFWKEERYNILKTCPVPNVVVRVKTCIAVKIGVLLVKSAHFTPESWVKNTCIVAVTRPS